MSKIWKTIPVFFCVMLFLCTSIPVQAAGLQVQWYNGETETDISVEKGQKFYLGDFISIIGKILRKQQHCQKLLTDRAVLRRHRSMEKAI